MQVNKDGEKERRRGLEGDEIGKSDILRVHEKYNYCYSFFYQEEDGIRDPLWSRGLGDVYKRQQVKKCN